MKKCSYCGRENDDAFVTCRGCGLELTLAETKPLALTRSSRDRTILALVTLVILIIIAITSPKLLLVAPLSVVFYLPLYLPFLLSFAIKSSEWRELRWALRLGSILAIFIRLAGMSNRPDFGNDAPGNIAGASHNFAWTWGSGIGCTLAALMVGLLVRCVRVRLHSRKFQIFSNELPSDK